VSLTISDRRVPEKRAREEIRSVSNYVAKVIFEELARR
jgi:hypothetical protein